MLEVIFSKEIRIDVKEDSEGFEIGGRQLKPEVERLSDGHFHLILDGVSFNVFVDSVDRVEKTITLVVNGKRSTVKIASEMDLLLKRMGINNAMSQKVGSLKAPMPGLIHSVLVEEGDEIKKGDTLLILEAMKMENVIKSAVDGKIKSVHVKKGESVEKSAKLISFE